MSVDASRLLLCCVLCVSSQRATYALCGWQWCKFYFYRKVPNNIFVICYFHTLNSSYICVFAYLFLLFSSSFSLIILLFNIINLYERQTHICTKHFVINKERKKSLLLFVAASHILIRLFMVRHRPASTHTHQT